MKERERETESEREERLPSDLKEPGVKNKKQKNQRKSNNKNESYIIKLAFLV